MWKIIQGLQVQNSLFDLMNLSQMGKMNIPQLFKPLLTPKVKNSKLLATKFVAGEPYSSSRFCGKIIQKHSYNWAKIQKEHLQLYYAIAARLLMIIIANENKRSFSFCDILRNQPRDYRQKSQEWYFVVKIVLTYCEKRNVLKIQNVFLRSQKQFFRSGTS